MCNAVLVDASEEAAEKVGQSNVLEHREDTRVIDTGKSSRKVSEKDTLDVGQSGGLNLKDVVCHLPRGDASLGRVNAPHGVPVKASTDGRSKKLAVTIAQCQRTKCIR